jgi:hypothetical protein
MSTTESTPPLLPVPSDVAGGALITFLALIQISLFSSGGAIAFIALLVVWPLLGGVTADFFSTRSRDRPLDGAVAGVFGGLTASVLVLLSGLIGVWPAFITANIGVSLWPVTLATLVATTLSWTVFGYLGAATAEEFA